MLQTSSERASNGIQSATHLNLNSQFLRHWTRLLITNHRFLFQTKQDRTDPLDSAIECFRIPGIRRWSIQRIGCCGEMIEREEGRKDRCVICKIFLVLQIRSYGTSMNTRVLTWTSLTTSYSSTSASLSMAVLLRMLLKSIFGCMLLYVDVERIQLNSHK